METEDTGQGSEGTNEVIESAETEQTGPVAESTSGEGEVKLNPAWNDLLGVVPSQLHSQVTPLLKSWDQNYQNSLQKVHSQYEPYKQYVDNQIAPDQVDYALNVMQAIQERPQEIVKALQTYMQATGATVEEAVEAVEEELDEEVPNELLSHPKFQQMEKTLNAVAQYLVQQQQTEANSREDARLADELRSLSEKYGEFDEEYVLAKALANPKSKLEEHVKDYHARINSALESKQRTPGPKVLGNGGTAPDNQVTKKDLNDPKARRSLVAQMLQQTSQS